MKPPKTSLALTSRLLPFPSVPALLATFTGAALLACSTQTAEAAVIFTDPFSTNASNWKLDSAGTTNATWVSTGGPLGIGDGYITRLTPTSGSAVMFRGQDNFNSSGDGFVRDWLGAGVSTFTIDILQDSGGILNFGLRFASSANSPGASTTAFSVPSGIWTNISIPITDSSSVFQTYEGSDFNTIFSAIGNVQVTFTPQTPQIHLSIDNPTISSVPEPTSLALLGMTGVFGLAMRRRRS